MRRHDVHLAFSRLKGWIHRCLHHLRVSFFLSPHTFGALRTTHGWGHRFGQGGFVSLLPVPVARMGSIQDLGRRLGISMTLFSIAIMIGPPISGAIYTSTGGYKAVGYYAGKRSSKG